MKFLSAIPLLLISSLSFGQISSIGVRFGLNSTNITSSTYSLHDDTMLQNGFVGGISYEYQFNKNFFIGTELNYNQRGYTTSYLFVIDEGNSVEHDGKEIYNYISLPIKSGFYFGEKVQGFGSVGVVPSFLINAKKVFPTHLDQNGQLDGMETQDMGDFTNSFDLAALVELGVNYKIKNQYSIFSSATYQRSFTSYINSDSYYYPPDSKSFHVGFSFSIGMRYTLSK